MRLLQVSLALNVILGLVVVAGVVYKVRGLMNRKPLGDTVYRTTRARLFGALPGQRARLVLLGDSLTDAAEWTELLGRPCANRGISGDTTVDVLRRLDDVRALKPEVVALMIGTNDLLGGAKPHEVALRTRTIVERLVQGGKTRVVLQSLLPVDEARAGVTLNARVRAVNDANRAACVGPSCTWLDVAGGLTTPAGGLDPELTPDGLHLLPEGYRRWAAVLGPALPPG